MSEASITSGITEDSRSLSLRLKNLGNYLTVRVVPALVVIGILVAIWQITCSRPDSNLPSATTVFEETRYLIENPFYDNGGTDVGMGWQLLASLKRVAIGYTLAVIAGVALGILVGQSVWAMRGLDPVFQILRTVPPLAWLPLSLVSALLTPTAPTG